MSVRIRLKRLGRRHRPFFRVCAMDIRAPRDGKVIEELGYYDPMLPETDARAILNGERIDYWLGVGAQPSDKVKVLIKKYGVAGTHLDQQRAALERLKSSKPQAPPPMVVPKPKPPEPPAAEKSSEPPAAESEAAAPEADTEAAAPEANTEAAAPKAAATEAPAPEAPAPAAAEAAPETEPDPETKTTEE